MTLTSRQFPSTSPSPFYLTTLTRRHVGPLQSPPTIPLSIATSLPNTSLFLHIITFLLSPSHYPANITVSPSPKQTFVTSFNCPSFRIFCLSSLPSSSSSCRIFRPMAVSFLFNLIHFICLLCPQLLHHCLPHHHDSPCQHSHHCHHIPNQYCMSPHHHNHRHTISTTTISTTIITSSIIARETIISIFSIVTAY